MNQTEAVDFAAPIFFYYRKGLSDVLYKVSTILYLDDDTCLAVAKPIPPLMKDTNFIDNTDNLDIKVLFNPQNQNVLSYPHIDELGITQDFEYAVSRTGSYDYYL